MSKLISLSAGDYTVNPPSGVPTSGNIGNLISWGVTALLSFGIVLTLVFLMYGGILWITSQGDKQKVQKARDMLMYVVMGIVIMLLSFFIVELIGYFFGVNLLNWDWFPYGGGGGGGKRI